MTEMLFELTDLLHLPVSLCNAAVFSIFFSRFLGTRYNSKKLYTAVYSIYFLVNAAFSILMPEAVSLLTIATCFCFPVLLYTGTIVHRVVCGGLLTAYAFVTDSLVMLTSSFIFKYTASALRADAFMYFIGAYSSAVVLLCMTLIITKRRRTSLSATPNKYYLALALIVWICAGLSFGAVSIVEQSGNPAGLAQLLSETAIAALSVLVFFVFESYQVHAEQKEHTALVEQQLLQEEQRFMLIDEQHREVMAIKHDITNHMTSIRELLAELQYDEATKYLNEYIAQTSPVLKRSITGKPSVDVLISGKIAIAESAGIMFEIKSDKLLEVRISPFHLNIILSNAIDNAIEACRKLPGGADRYISLGMKTESDNLCIRIINSSLPTKIAAGGLPATSKDDSLHHGYGLSAIKRVVEHYDGAILCAYDNGEFTLYVQIMNRPAEVQ